MEWATTVKQTHAADITEELETLQDMLATSWRQGWIRAAAVGAGMGVEPESPQEKR